MAAARARATSALPLMPVSQQSAITPLISRPASQPPQIPQTAQAPQAPHKSLQQANESSNTSKKRKTPDSGVPQIEPQQSAKKPRQQEQQVVKKAEPQSRQQVAAQRATEQEPAPAILKKAPKAESAPKKEKPESASKEKPELTSNKEKSSKPSTATESRISKSWPKSVGKQKVKGLSNPGNWCYRRSILQSLIAVPQFFNLLDDSHKACPKQGKCVTCAMKQLLKGYHTTSGGVGQDLKALDNAIRVTGKTSDPRWRAGGQTQEDSHEFLQYLLGTVENAKGVQKEQFASLFRIKHRISWTCDNCRRVHVHSDPPGLSLNLPIARQSNITACLDTYHREPNVVIRCDKCKKNSKRTRIFQIEDAPEVLPIQLMRFGFTGFGTSKNKQHIEYPEDLDLTRWALDKSKPLKYRLQAVVAHSGNLKFGHYIAYVRGPDGIKDISDDSVSNTSAKEWRKPSSGFNPYILVYIKQ